MEVTSVEEECLLHFVFSSSLTVITHKRATMATHRQRGERDGYNVFRRKEEEAEAVVVRSFLSIIRR